MPHNDKPMRLFIPITKIDAQKRIVYGTLTEEVADKTGEIFDYATGKDAFITWSNEALERSQGKSKGNLRAMHGKVAAGKFNDIVYDDENKRIEGAAKVSDDQEWAKVEDGTYTGFSIGGDYAKRWVDPVDPNLMRYTPVLAEVSLVDNPCVASATFQVIKADGSTETRNFKTTTEQTIMPAENLPQNTEDAEQVWKATDGSTHATKAAAVARSAEHAAAQAVQPLADANAELAAAIAKAKGDDKDSMSADDQDKDKSKKAKKDKEDGETDDKAEKDAVDDADAAARDKIKDPAPTKAAEAPVTKSDELTGKLKKGLDAVSRLACLIQELEWLQGCIEWEAIVEADGSPQPAKLDMILKQLCSFLMDLCAEESGEMFDGGMDMAMKSAKINALAKKGARHSAKDMEMMAKAHDHATEVQKCMKAMGYGDAEEKDTADKAVLGEMQKMAQKNEALEKSLADQVTLIKSMAEMVEQIANSPAPRKGVLKSVGKTDDVVATTETSNQPTDKTDTLSLIKTAQRNPIFLNK